MLMFEWFYTSHLFWWGQEGISICLCLYSFTPVFFFLLSQERDFYMIMFNGLTLVIFFGSVSLLYGVSQGSMSKTVS